MVRKSLETPVIAYVEFLSQMKIPTLRDSLYQGWGDFWLLPFRAQRIKVLSLAHNGSSAFAEKEHFLASTSCVKLFRSNFKAMSFQGLHWLQKLESGKASFVTKVM